MKKFFLFFLILVISSSLAYAVPELPMIVTGEARINENPAKIGTEITAKVNEKVATKVEVKEKGKFTLLLQNLNSDNEVKFYVDNIDTLQSIRYKSGDFKQLTLKVEKSYLVYYLTGGLIALVAILAIWRFKRR